MKVVLIGATGVLGRNLVPCLLGQGHTLRVLARSVEKARASFPAEVDCAAFDLLAEDAPATLPALLLGYEAVMHIATSIPLDPAVLAGPDAWRANNLLRTVGVRRALNAALAAGVKTYVQQSITMAYPDCGEAWISEDMALDDAPGRGHVTAAVREMEAMVRDVPLSRLRWILLRGASFVGPETAQVGLIARLRAGQESVPGDGRNFVSLVHVADAAAAFALALTRAPGGAIYNVSGAPLRQGEYYDRLAHAIGAPRPPRDHTRVPPPSWRCSNERARMDLGWEPAGTLIPPPG